MELLHMPHHWSHHQKVSFLSRFNVHHVWLTCLLPFASIPWSPPPFQYPLHVSDDKCGVSSFDRALMDRMVPNLDLEKQPLFIFIIITIVIVSYHPSLDDRVFDHEEAFSVRCIDQTNVLVLQAPMHHAPRISKALQTHHGPLGVGHPKSW